MKNLVNTYMDQFRQDRQKQLKLAAILAALAVIVAGVVFWQLHYTGVAMSNEVYCGQEEHIHDESCYVDGVLVCGIPEHTHTVECLTDETADVETEKDWEATLPEGLSGVWADDVTAIAESQLGYTESERNFQLAEDGETRQGYTRYGAWYGNEYGDWDAMFVSFCLNYAGVPEDEVPESSGAYALAVAMTDMGICVYDDGFVPEAGDLVFFDTDKDETIDSVGIVKELTADDTEITGIAVIEGNSNDAVEETKYDLNDPMIVAFGILPEQPEDETVIEIGSDLDTNIGTESGSYIDRETGVVNDADSVTGTVVIPADAEVDPETGEITFLADGITYRDKTVNLWIHDGEGIVIGDYDENDGLTCDVLVYTDPDTEEEYVLIPVSIFENALAEEDFEFDDSGDCPICYAVPDTDEDNAEGSEGSEEIMESCEYDSLSADGQTEWYVRVPDSEDETSDRMDVYYIVPYGYKGDASGKIVLNLGNGNGDRNFADYTGSRSAGTLLRYTTEDLREYALESGELEINLPSDNDLDTTFEVVDEDDFDDLPGIYIELGREAKYDYKLVGWVNIATGEYFSVRDSSVKASVNLENENVFYADWISNDYNHGSDDDKDLREDTVSTGGFTTIEMYDYNELFNMYSASLEQNGTTSETWSDSEKLNSTLLGLGDGNTEITQSFVFNNDGTAYSAAYGMLEYMNNRTAGNTWTGNINNTNKKYVIDATTTWGIEKPGDTILGLLFDKDSANSTVGVNYVGEADNLFWVDEDGYYTYDSSVSAATYNAADERFYVYNEPQGVESGSRRPCFLPYNEYSSDNSTYSVYDGSIDYWFGMKMEVDFYLPSATGAQDGEGHYGNQVNGADMVFNFSGDDDIMIFVDNDLVLDMSGIHNMSYGSINFSTGEVKIGFSRDDDGAIDTTYGSTSTTSIKSGNHKLTVYYMERGGYESNLEIQFNVVPIWDYTTGDVQTVVAEKTWVDSSGNVIENPETISSVYSSVDVGLFDVLSPADGDSMGYTQSGSQYTFAYTDDSGTTHVFVYDSSVPSLTYTEDDEDPIVFTDKDDEGRVLDTYGHVVCWLDGSLLHMRMDAQELNSENNWSYTWELLDAEGVYEVLELSESSSYVTTSSSDDLYTYRYWSIIGDLEIEQYFEDLKEGTTTEPLKIILTEAAQEAENTLGDTKEAYGYVIVADSENIGDLDVKQVKFSQRATLEKKENESGNISYFGTYGVTSQSEIDGLGDGAIWYLVDSGKAEDDTGGGSVEAFYLYCILNETNYYLALSESQNELYVTSNENEKCEFFYDSLGELMIELPDDAGTVRVEILDNGIVNIDVGEEEAAVDDVRIYTLTDTKTSGFTFTAVNTFLPVFTLLKLDSVTGLPVEGVSFTLWDISREEYYKGLNTDTDEVEWSETEVALTTDENGKIILYYLPDGYYILTEVQTADGYNLLPSSIFIEIYDGGNLIARWTDSSTDSRYQDFLKVSDDYLMLTILNQAGMELPKTGGMGTWIYTVIGICLIGSAAVTLVYRKRRAVRS